MKIYETEEKVIISIPKSKIKFSTIYGDKKGFYLRFYEMLSVEDVCALERAVPARSKSEAW